MASITRIARRLSGSPGSPATLRNGELAYNEVDDTLYYGKGVSSGDIAANVIAIAGAGYGVTIATAQTITGNKSFTGTADVPTVLGSSNSTSAASTAWVRGFAQPVNANLTSLSGVATNGFLVQTSSGNYTTRTVTGTAGRITVTNGDGVSGSPTLDLNTTGVTAGRHTAVTVDAYGRATVGGNITSTDVTTALTFTPENAANKGVINGYASLDGSGTVPLIQLPSSITGGLFYIGVWNASTNTPTLVNGTGTKGNYYKVSVAGNTTINGNSNWTAGDMIIFNGTTWDKAEGGAPDVVSVAGRIGAITLTTADIGGLGTMATQNANAVAITGGTIDGVTLDAGTF
jgi:hypothetical protein